MAVNLVPLGNWLQSSALCSVLPLVLLSPVSLLELALFVPETLQLLTSLLLPVFLEYSVGIHSGMLAGATRTLVSIAKCK